MERDSVVVARVVALERVHVVEETAAAYLDLVTPRKTDIVLRT